MAVMWPVLAARTVMFCRRVLIISNGNDTNAQKNPAAAADMSRVVWSRPRHAVMDSFT